MIREFREEDLDLVSDIWLETNIDAHPFVSEHYWRENQEMVKEMFKQAELYVFEKDETIIGFVELDETYIAGIFVSKKGQSQGVGKALLNHIKQVKETLSLSVYEKNEKAIAFYIHQGFTIDEKLLEEENQEVEYIMSWKK